MQLARVLQTKLFLYPRAVSLDGGDTNPQPETDLPCGPAFANQLEDGQLAIGQALERSAPPLLPGFTRIWLTTRFMKRGSR